MSFLVRTRSTMMFLSIAFILTHSHTAAAGNAWIPTIKTSTDTRINHDWSSGPIYFKTNSADGSDGNIDIIIYNEQDGLVENFEYRFSERTFMLYSCMTEFDDLHTNPPNAVEKEWEIARLPGPRVTIHCNNVKVVDLLMSASSCDKNIWSSSYNEEMTKFRFCTCDTASYSYYYANLRIDGGWSGFEDWTDCPKPDCRGMTRTRSRSCTNPAPAYDGAECQGESAETQTCRTRSCPGKFMRMILSSQSTCYYKYNYNYNR